MILDEYDLRILKEFCKLKENEWTTTWKIMKKIYNSGKERENIKIKRRIEKMAGEGLFIIDGNPKTYTLDSDKVILRKFSFPDKRMEAIAINVCGKWEVFEL